MKYREAKLFSAAVLFFLTFSGLSYGQERPAPASPSTAALIPIEGEIDRFQVVFLRRSIQRAREAEVDSIIFSINTFGGRVDSALQMATLIGGIRDIETVAYIPAEPESVGVSWSAGALISFSAQKIFMSPGTSIGAAAPVYQTAEGSQAAGEKTVSAVRTQMAAIAERNGYPPEVAVAMVDKDVILQVAEDGDRFRFRLLSDDEEADRDTAWKTISPRDKLLSLTSSQMERYRISSGSPEDLEALKEMLRIGELSRIRPSSTDRVVNILTSAGLSSLLLTIGLLALYMEITSPGFGVPGTVALVAFAVLFLSSGLMGTLSSLELLLFLAGVILLIVEVFVLPGFGVAGISGLVLMTVGLVLSRQGFILPEQQWQWNLFVSNLLLVLGTLTGSFLMAGVLMFFFPRFRLFQKLILSSSLGGEADAEIRGSTPVSADGALGEGEQHPPSGQSSLVGREGRTKTALHPTGRAAIEGDIYPVVSEGRWIETDRPVRVVAVEGNRIVVEEVRR